MSSAFVLTSDAERDLNEIWDYIGADNPDAATRVLDAFEAAFRRFAQNPGLGHYREDSRTSDTDLRWSTHT